MEIKKEEENFYRDANDGGKIMGHIIHVKSNEMIMM